MNQYVVPVYIIRIPSLKGRKFTQYIKPSLRMYCLHISKVCPGKISPGYSIDIISYHCKGDEINKGFLT